MIVWIITACAVVIALAIFAGALCLQLAYNPQGAVLIIAVHAVILVPLFLIVRKTLITRRKRHLLYCIALIIFLLCMIAFRMQIAEYLCSPWVCLGPNGRPPKNGLGT